MSQPKLAPVHLYLLPLAISLLLILSPARHCRAQGGSSDHKPLVSPLGKDLATSLYTISIKDGAPLVVDLAGPLVWSTCASGHPTFPCSSGECAAANGDSPAPSCGHADGGSGQEGKTRYCTCTAYPCNPVTGRCAAGDLTSFAMSANATDGRNPLYPVSFSAVGSCAPDRLLQSLPAGAAGVAGLSRGPLSLPSQLAERGGLGSSRFALCLPGVAVFGNTTLYLMYYPVELTSTIASTPLARNPRNGGAYYIPVEAISVSWDVETPVALPPRALELDAATGRGGVALSTVARYTAMRADVYRPFIQAFDTAISRPGYVVKVAAVRPFELCYDTFSLRRLKRTGWDVPTIRMELAAGATRNWTINNGNSMLQVGDRTVCLAFVEMGADAGAAVPGMATGDAPAVVIGGYQLEDNLLVFDADKEELRFSGLLWGSGATCSGFNFTVAQ